MSEVQHYYHVCDGRPDEDIHAQVKRYFSIEGFGVKIPEKQFGRSNNDRRANAILNATMEKLNCKYEIG